MKKLFLFITFIYILNIYSQCDTPPTFNSSSGIVSSSGGAIEINGQTCTRIGMSSNYRCDGVEVDLDNDTFTISDGDCVWTVADGDWETIEEEIPLPVTISQYYVENKNSTNIIRWSTESELNNNYFTLQESNEGINWIELVNILGSGYSSTTINYVYEDYFYKNVINYYKLSQYDFNGKSKELGIVSIDNRQPNKILIKKTNLLGQDVNDYYSGIVIYQYNDGTFIKSYQN